MMLDRLVVLSITFHIFISLYFNPYNVNAMHSTVIRNDLIIVNTNKNELTYVKKGIIIKKFKVATGSSRTPTPLGTFKIVNKIKNRPYYKKNIPGGSPENPLGKRWLGLNVNGTWGTTYAIHGNNNESTIGKKISHGCIRMHNKDIEWLFDQVTIETKVHVTDSNETYKQIASNTRILH